MKKGNGEGGERKVSDDGINRIARFVNDGFVDDTEENLHS